MTTRDSWNEYPGMSSVSLRTKNTHQMKPNSEVSDIQAAQMSETLSAKPPYMNEHSAKQSTPLMQRPLSDAKLKKDSLKTVTFPPEHKIAEAHKDKPENESLEVNLPISPFVDKEEKHNSTEVDIEHTKTHIKTPAESEVQISMTKIE